MKTQILMLLLAVCWSTQTMAQDDDMEYNDYQESSEEMTPEIVVKAMMEKYPNSTEIYWSQGIDDPTIWIAEFDADGKITSAEFDADGNWIVSTLEFDMEELPKTISNQLSSTFGDYELLDIKKQVTPQGEGYAIMIGDNNNGGTYEVVIDPNGKMTQKSMEEESEE